MFLRMLIRSLRLRKSRIAVAFLSVLVGATIASALVNLYHDVNLKMTRELRAYGANLIVTPTDGLQSEVSSPAASRLLDEDRVSRLGSPMNRKILSYVPYLYTASWVGRHSVVVVGSRFDQLRKMNPWWKVEGRWAEAEPTSQCMVGQQVAKQLGLSPNRSLVLRFGNSPDAESAPFLVSGLVETGASEEDQIFVGLPALWRLTGHSGKVSAIALSVVGTAPEIEQLAKAIEKTVSGVRAKPVRQIAQSEGQIILRIKSMMVVVIVIILLISSICVMTTLVAMVAERRKEVALMKALGAENFSVATLLLAEAVLIGAAGGVLGYGLGLGLAHTMEESIFKSAITVRPIVFPIVFALSCLISALASFLSIRKATQIEPAVMLKVE